MERDVGYSTNDRSPPPPPNPGFLSQIFIWWMNPLLYKGFSKRALEHSDLYRLQQENEASVLQEKFEKYWNEELRESSYRSRKPSMIIPIWRCFRKNILVSGAYSVVAVVLGIANALFIGYVVEGLHKESSGNESISLPYMVLALCLGSFIVAICIHQLQYFGLVTGMQLRIALTCLVYKKMLRLSRVAVGNLTAGYVINLISNDVRKFDKFFFQFHFLWLGPLDLLIVTILAWRLVGWPSLLGSMYLVMMIPSSLALTKQVGKVFLKICKLTDRRVRLTGEVISGIRAIKMYAWEIPLASMIKLTRRFELHKLHLKAALWVCIDVMFTSSTPMINLILYTTLSMTGYHFIPQTIFTILALYEETRYNMAGNFLFQMRFSYEGLMALKRIKEFLLFPEKGSKALQYDNLAFDLTFPTHWIKRYEELPSKGCIGTFRYLPSNEVVLHNSKVETSRKYMKQLNDVEADTAASLVIENTSCYWNNESKKTCLSNIDLNIPNAKLVAICGEVGSGKSSLLMAVLGEIVPACGKVSCHGRVAYAPQVPWVFSGTIRQNIIFGLPYDEQRYRDTIEACQLVSDMQTFPDGDLTYIGERGITLSGGQRARVSLARAVYFNADIYLLDDPMSALDTQVGKKLFFECFKEMLRKCIVILVTHNLSYLPEVDCVIVMKRGSIYAKGSYHKLKQDGMNLLFGKGDKLKSVKEQRASENEKDFHNIDNQSLELKNLKAEKEDRAVGSVPLRIHWKYFSAGNSAAMAIVLCLLLLTAQVLMNTGEWWLAQWTNQPYMEQQNRANIYVYAGIIVTFFLVCFASEILMYHSFLRSNQILQEKMVMSILKAPVLFFDTNPAGRILNKFSKDLGYMDQELPTAAYYVTLTTLMAIGSLVLVAAVLYWAVISACFVLVLFALLGMTYLRTSREVKRLDAISRSPMYSHITDTLEGLTSIQCFQAEERLTRDFFRFQDEETRAWFVFISGREWLGLRLELLAVTYLAAAAIAAVVTSANAGVSGLALYSAFSLAKIVQYTVMSGVEYENLMTSVERVLTYIQTTPEPGYQVSTKPPADWPSRGEIQFENVSFVYYEGGPTILQDISFHIKKQEKVGIVGHTGAGKSSLLAALFRMPEARGKILIDGLDISNLELQSTRAVMSVIPQAPVLLSGDLRNNLDPFSVLEDKALWSALEQVQLKDKVQALPGQLQYQLNESGSNLSVGERQLVCLARALLQNNKIIVIDEATANVDHETDQKIQKMIGKNFSECTVLTIAHRLDTILDSDRVMVLSKGKVVEFDSPQALLERKDSLFSELVVEFRKTKHK